MDAAYLSRLLLDVRRLHVPLLEATANGPPEDRELVGRLLDAARELERTDRSTTPQSAAGVDQAQWLTELLANSPDIISIVDLQGRLLYVSRTVPGGDPGNVVGHLATDYVPESHRVAWTEALERAISLGAPQHVEINSVRSYWWDTRLVPIHQGGKVSAVLTIGTDITQRKKAEAELALREQQLGLALAASGMGLWRWSVATNEVSWDATSKRLFGWPLEDDDIVFEDVLTRVHAEDRERLRHHTDETIATGIYRDIELRLLLPDQSTRWILGKGGVLRDADGRVTDLVGGVVDVTHHREAEVQLRRTQKLEAIGQLAGGVAHDFNNLLTIILGSLGMITRIADPTRRAAVLEDATEAAKRAAELTGQLLAFGRRQRVREAELDLNQCLTDILKLLRHALPENIDVAFTAGADLPNVFGDRGQLEQVITNLCLNSRDAMPAGGTLTLATNSEVVDGRFLEDHSGARIGRYVLLRVTDTGSGIRSDVVDRVFEPYFTTKEKGSGLGLATVYGIVKQHGGMVYVTSRPGHGTTFDVYLPVAEQDAARTERRALEPTRGGTETILLAEDDASVREVVVNILSTAGYRVLTVDNGVEAVDQFRQHSGEIDLLVFDAVMPRKSGVDALREIMALDPSVRAMLSTGYSEQLTAEQGAPGGYRVLRKPYEPDTLLRAVRLALDEHPRRLATGSEAPDERPGRLADGN